MEYKIKALQDEKDLYYKGWLKFQKDIDKLIKELQKDEQIANERDMYMSYSTSNVINFLKELKEKNK